MNLNSVQFKHTVSFGGMLQSCSTKAVGDRPGQGGMLIELSEDGQFISLTKNINGKPQTRIVPMTNVASFEPIPEKPATQVKK